MKLLCCSTLSALRVQRARKIVEVFSSFFRIWLVSVNVTGDGVNITGAGVNLTIWVSVYQDPLFYLINLILFII
jgi:hypothetical protein